MTSQPQPGDLTDWLLARITCPRCAEATTQLASTLTWPQFSPATWAKTCQVLACTAAGHPGVLHQTVPDRHDPPDHHTVQPIR